MGIRTLVRLAGRVASLAVPCRRHALEAEIADRLAAWTRRTGLATHPRTAATVAGGDFARLAGLTFAGAPAERVALFAGWLTWRYCADDELDGGYAGVEDLRRGVLGTAFDDLWGRTAPTMGRGWRDRFHASLDLYAQGCRTEAVNRASGRMPRPGEYERLRRRTNNPWVYDLAEPVLGTEVPAGVAGSPEWRGLLDGINDATAWCNDLASLETELDLGDVHNYVLVLAHAHRLPLADAADRVGGRVAARLVQAGSAARTLPAAFARYGTDARTGYAVSRVACALLGTPRAHLDWIFEGPRYLPLPLDKLHAHATTVSA